MTNSRFQKPLIWAVVLSESTHLLCCVLPTVVSVMGLLAGLGMIASLPAGLLEVHDFMHHWEIPMIAASGVILALGWLAILYSDRIDCRSTGCEHGGCAPSKSRAHLVLKIATALFFFNVFVYVVVHRSDWFNANSPLVHSQQADDHAHAH